MTTTDELQTLLNQLTDICQQNAKNIEEIANREGVSIKSEFGADKNAFLGIPGSKKKARSDMSKDEVAGVLARQNAVNLARLARELGVPASKVVEGAAKDSRPEQKTKLMGLSGTSSETTQGERTKLDVLGLSDLQDEGT